MHSPPLTPKNPAWQLQSLNSSLPELESEYMGQLSIFPPVQNEFAGQMVHSPPLSPKKPAWQLQSLRSSLPELESEYRGQLSIFPPIQNVLLGHRVHSVPAVSVTYPARQIQLVIKVLPIAELVSAGHTVHSCVPFTSL